AGDDVPGKDEVLDRPGPIEPPLGADAGEVLVPRPGLGQQRHRIARHPDHREDGQAEDEKRDKRVERPPQDETGHRFTSPPLLVRRASVTLLPGTMSATTARSRRAHGRASAVPPQAVARNSGRHVTLAPRILFSRFFCWISRLHRLLLSLISSQG